MRGDDGEPQSADTTQALSSEQCPSSLREIGPSVYNQAIADAQTYVQEKVADLGGARYQAEFDYWKKR